LLSPLQHCFSASFERSSHPTPTQFLKSPRRKPANPFGWACDNNFLFGHVNRNFPSDIKIVEMTLHLKCDILDLVVKV